MSKLNVGVGEDFPLDDAPKLGQRMPCEEYLRMRRARRARWRHSCYAGPATAMLFLPATAAALTAAILYPLTTLGVIGGLGLVGAAYSRRRSPSEDEASHDGATKPKGEV